MKKTLQPVVWGVARRKVLWVREDQLESLVRDREAVVMETDLSRHIQEISGKEM